MLLLGLSLPVVAWAQDEPHGAAGAPTVEVTAEAEAPAELAEQGTAEERPQDPMEELFADKCASCHTVGKGVRTGPDLKDAHERRDRAWLVRLIAVPSKMLDSDPDARDLVAEFDGVRMPDLALDDEQVEGLVDLIERCSAEGADCNLVGSFVPVAEATEDDIRLGGELFVGTVPIKSGAPACISCHAVQGASGVVAGGTLSKDLTNVFARLGDEGLNAALKNPAFEVMNKVFADHPLDKAENFALRSYLDQANRSVAAPSSALSLALFGLLGMIASLVGLNAGWRRRLLGVRVPLVKSREMKS